MDQSNLDLRQCPIVVVDDEQDDLDAFQFSFERVSDLRAARSGAEALEILGESDPAVIVTDRRMSRMTGIEL